jgi:hypothetical protein
MPYGFPSGKELVKQICDPANRGDFASLGIDNETLDNFIKELRLSHQSSVDAFLEHRPEFMDVGKKAIALYLIRYENEDALSTSNEDWYTYLLDRMTEGTPFIDFGKNRVGFVTFNYDRSLEHYLLTTLRSRYGKSSEEVADVLRQLPIIHVHGSLGYLPWQKQEVKEQRKYESSRTKDAVEIAAKGIKIISEHLDSSKEFGESWDLMVQAKLIAILGFGYNEVNVKRLRLPLTQPGARVIGTCKGFLDAERRRLSEKHKGLWLSNTGNGIMDFLRNDPDLRLE